MQSYAILPYESHLVAIIEELQEETNVLRNNIKKLEKQKDDMLEEREDDLETYKIYEASNIKRMEEIQQLEYNTIEVTFTRYIYDNYCNNVWTHIIIMITCGVYSAYSTS